ncbi:MAG TPA: ferritin-like domain-containing protein [Terracidiphilus sp.]
MSAVIRRGLSRRNFLAGVGCTAGAAAVAATGCGGSSKVTTPTPNPTITDADVLNFALNLEYLEAEFYLRAATGTGLANSDIGSSAGAVTGGAQVPFKTQAIQQYAMEIADDEQAHVQFLRKALGTSAVARPAINFTDAFNAAASAAGIGPAFNPFADEESFLLGAFVFEDVGVTAYHGAAGLLSSVANLQAAAAIMAVEAYHAGEIRTLIAQTGGSAVTYANKISALRGAAGGGGETSVSTGTIVAADSDSIAYDRTTDQVLHIVYLNATAGSVSKGGFFPNGLNGTITSSAS